MRREEKVRTVAALHERLQAARVALVADYRGLSAAQMDELRRRVRELGGRCHVAKNTLVRLALEATPFVALATLLEGPLVLLLGTDQAAELAKVLVRFAEEHGKPAVRGGVLEGELIEPARVKELAELPPREVIYARLLGTLQAPAARLLATLKEPAARVARLVDAIGKRAEAGGRDGGGEAGGDRR